MQLNQPKDANIKKLVIDGQEIAVVDDLIYLGSTEKDVNTRIALAWVAFVRLIPLLRAEDQQLYSKNDFNAACISILLYVCESWILTEPLKKKQETFARKLSELSLELNRLKSI